MVRVASVNVNGVRAAFRKGMQPWLEASGVDVLALQEVRAEREDLEALLGDTGLLPMTRPLKEAEQEWLSPPR